MDGAPSSIAHPAAWSPDAPAVAAVFAEVTNVLTAVATVLPSIEPVFTPVANVLEAVARAALVAPVPPILETVTDVFAPIPNILTPIPPILEAVADVFAPVAGAGTGAAALCLRTASRGERQSASRQYRE